MPFILAISASPSRTSKTAALTDHVLSQIHGPDVVLEHLRLRDLDPVTLLKGPWDSPQITQAILKVNEADAVIIATPIFKASFSGLLKAFLDILPQFGLAGKAVLPLATGGSIAHVLALDYALRPVLQSMGARHIVQSYFLPEALIDMTSGSFDLSTEGAAPLNEAVYHFMCALRRPPEDTLLGHPRPNREMAAA